ncbi:hypothetical protein TRAPUB_8633 [Trametes pubescens]|uniref:DUF6589 domain-containing protein n=1 Tax=Trametes pubescens TaxID=154538 RepID=A0A1M2W4Q5_TRAPU|nr:hypothetical protein TRAPUB_8633 [Trametes pubescens]
MSLLQLDLLDEAESSPELLYNNLPPSSPPLPSLLEGFQLYRLSSSPTTPKPPAEPDRPIVALPARPVDNDQDAQYSTDHVNESSPARTVADKRRKGWKKRHAANNTAKAKATTREGDVVGPFGIAVAEEEPSAADVEAQRRQTLEMALNCLLREGLSLGDLVLYVSDPSNKKGTERYQGLFSIPGRVEEVLDFWASSRNSRTGRQAVHGWAVSHVKHCLDEEGNAATRAKFLQARTMDIDPSFVLNFSLDQIRTQLTELCPTALDLFHAFSTTARQQKEQSSLSETRKRTLVTTQVVLALAARSQSNSYVRQVMGLYPTLTGTVKLPSGEELCAEDAEEGTPIPDSTNGTASGINDGPDPPQEQPEGAQAEESRNGIDAGREEAGVEAGAPSHVENDRERDGATTRGPGPGDDEQADARPSEGTSKLKSGLKRALGLLRLLSDSTMRVACGRARTHLLANVYDNINMMFKIAEQILGRSDSQQNGTCATAFELYGASLDDMKTADVLESFVKAPPLAIEDMLLSDQENVDLTARLEHTVLQIVAAYGGERFSRFRNQIDASMPVTEDKIPVHKTAIYPLPAMNIDESSTTGNADVLAKIYKNLTLDMNSPEFTRYVKVVSGDQLSIARIRSLVQNRAGHEALSRSFLWALCMPGLFHYKMAATHGLLELHYGTQSRSDPGSLVNHNASLNRKPIVLTSFPPFRTARDLIFVSLYARVLHCLLLVSGCDSLDYANTQVAQRVREKREEERRAWEAARQEQVPSQGPDDDDEKFVPKEGDEVFENAILYMRDGLVMREYNDAVKSGDSGRVVTVLKLWALAFRGSGRTKYAYEMLHLIHNLTHVWPASLRKIILQNWLVNPTGKPNAWVETIYQAHGSNASWEWLAMISPCVDILRRLVTQINAELGGRQGVKHTSPDLERDIKHLMDSLNDKDVYTEVPGRRIESDGPKSTCVPNAVGLGWTQLAGPLADFNVQLRRLQKRCTTVPLTGAPYTSAQPAVTVSAGAAVAPTAVPSSDASVLTAAQTLAHASTAPLDGDSNRGDRPTLNIDATLPTGLAPHSSSSVPVDPAAAEEEEYWSKFPWDDLDTEESSSDSFTLDSAADVALDMDDLCTLDE